MLKFRKSWIHLGFGLWIVTRAAGAVAAELPVEALQMLQSFPNAKVTLDLVLSRAIQYSDSYRLLSSQLKAMDVAFYQSRAPMDVRLTADLGHTENKNRPLNPVFQQKETYGNQFSLGVSGYVPSGTSLSLKFTHGVTDLRFENPLINVLAYESKLTLDASQNLLRDFFGYGTRKLMKSGDESRAAAKDAYDDAVEEWMFGLTQLFYGAWLAQTQARSAAETLQRRERLVEVTRQKLKRGTAERPDFLQIENAMALTRLQATKAYQDLGDQWRGLVTKLKLSDEFLSIDPILVPMEIDSPVESAAQACGEDPSTTIPANPTRQRQALHQMAAAEALAARASNSRLPELQAFAQLAGNDVNNTSFGNTLADPFAFRYPAWTVGARVVVPLASFQERADQIQANSNLIRADAEASDAAAVTKLDWLNSCSNVKRLQAVVGLLKQNYEGQLERARLEENRFNVGRSTTAQVIQAQDDASAASLSLSNSEVELRLAAWRVQRMSDGFKAYQMKLAQVIEREGAR